MLTKKLIKKIYKAILKNGIVELEPLISSVKDLNYRNKIGDTCLIIATKYSDSYINVKLLLEKGADPTIVDNQNNTPLINAVINNNLDIVKLLLSYDSNVNHIGYNNWSPLMNAVYYQYFDIVKLLINYNPNIKLRNSNNLTAIDIAFKNNSENIGNYLINSLKIKKEYNRLNRKINTRIKENHIYKTKKV